MTPTTSPSFQRNDVAEDTQSSLVRDARLLLDAVGIERGGNWISRTVRTYLAAAVRVPFGLFLSAEVSLSNTQRRALAERADLRYLLSYADPTGETAIRNVEREQRG